jgi:hypothetical protein
MPSRKWTKGPVYALGAPIFVGWGESVTHGDQRQRELGFGSPLPPLTRPQKQTARNRYWQAKPNEYRGKTAGRDANPGENQGFPTHYDPRRNLSCIVASSFGGRCSPLFHGGVSPHSATAPDGANLSLGIRADRGATDFSNTLSARRQQRTITKRKK